MHPTVVLTQPAPRAAGLAAALGGRGIATTCWPMTDIDEALGLDWPALAATLAGCRWVLFASPAAIDVTMAALRRHALCWPAGVGVGLIGPGSHEVLEAWSDRIEGLRAAPRIAPRAAPYDAESLLSRDELQSLRGVGVAVLRRADGREAWLRALRARGAALHAITVYSARDAGPPPDAARWLCDRVASGAPVAFSIASVDAGERLAAFAGALSCGVRMLGCPALTQHPRIAEALRGLGWRRVVLHRPGAEGLIAAIESLDDR
jgi:uroporphyrinogen-III synthase